MKKFPLRSLRIMCGALVLSFAFGCSGGNASFIPNGNSTPLVSIEVTPTNPRIALSTTRQFTTTGIYSDNSRQDITASVTWSSSSTAVATISNTAGSNGLATSVAAGSTTITATSGGVSGSTALTVTSATLQSIQISPTNPSIALDTTRQFTATGIYSDNTTQDISASVVWSSSLNAVATISNTAGSNGLATAIGAGSTTITATSGAVSDSTTLTVTSATLQSIQVSPTNPIIALGTTRQFSATGIFSDNTSQDMTASVTWSSSSPAVATISNNAGSNGLTAAVAAGSTTITATSGVISGSTTLTVTSATLVSIQVAPTNPSIALGTIRQFTATGIFSDNTSQDITASVTWSSSLPAIATISNTAGSNGLATSIFAGPTVISATSRAVSGSTMLTVTSATLVSIQVAPTNPSIALGTTVPFTATGVYSDNTTGDLTASVTWSSSAAAFATISNARGSSGLATAVAAGSTVISATSGAASGSTTLNVTSATLVSVQVAPTNPSVALGTTRQFTATGIYSDNTSQDMTVSVTWSSSNTAVAIISNAPGSNGLATAVAAGSATIQATLGTVNGSTLLTVSPATLVSIDVSPTNLSIALGTTRQFTAMGIYSDNTAEDLTALVTWKSSAAAIAAVSNVPGSKGLATSVGAGLTTITATLASVSGGTDLTVTSATLVSIQVTPTDANIAKGTTTQFIATGIFSDNSSQDLTNFVTWSSLNSVIATISNAAGSNGLVTAADVGQTSITATFSGISDSTTISVTGAVLQTIDVTPALTDIALGTPQQFTAIGTYSDDTTEDLTASVIWSSSSSTVAAVSNAQGFKGLATSVGAGLTTITATLGGVSGNTDLTVTSATLLSIEVTSAESLTVPKGMNEQFSAIGIYTDGSSQDLTALVTWSSSNTGIATVSNAAGYNGLATTLAAGSTVISAKLGTVTGTSAFTVTTATLLSISITPVTAQIARGTTQQFTVTATFSDASIQDITASAVWTTSNKAVATISTTGATKGLATAVGAGTATITAAMGAVTNTATLTVTSATLSSVAIAPTNQTVAVKAPIQYTATGTFSDTTTQDLTSQGTWRSSNRAIATISNTVGSKGLATPVAIGNTTISAALTIAGTTRSISTGLTVTAAGATLVRIDITPVNPHVAVGRRVNLTATGVYSNGLTQNLTTNSQMTWSSSNPSIARVSTTRKGRVYGVSAGTVIISAQMASSITGTVTLTVP